MALLNNFLLSSSYDGTVKVWSIKKGECLSTLKKPKQTNLYNPIHAIILNKKGGTLFAGYKDSTIDTWDINKLSHPIYQKDFQGHAGAINSLKFDQESQRLVSSANDCTIRIWDCHSQKNEKIITQWSDPSDITFYRKRIVFSSLLHSRLGLYKKTASWQRAITSHKGGIRCLASNQKLLVTGGYDDTIKIWELPRHKLSKEEVSFYKSLKPYVEK